MDGGEYLAGGVVSLPGYLPPTPRQQCPCISKGCRDEPLQRWFRGAASALLHANNHLYRGNPMTVIGEHITSGWTVSTHTPGSLYRRSSLGRHGEYRLILWPANGHLRIQRSGFQAMVWQCFLFRNTVCWAGWPPGYACIFSYRSRQVPPPMEELLAIDIHWRRGNHCSSRVQLLIGFLSFHGCATSTHTRIVLTRLSRFFFF